MPHPRCTGGKGERRAYDFAAGLGRQAIHNQTTNKSGRASNGRHADGWPKVQMCIHNALGHDNLTGACHVCASDTAGTSGALLPWHHRVRRHHNKQVPVNTNIRTHKWSVLHMAIPNLFILNSSGELIIDKQWVPGFKRSVCDIFWDEVLKFETREDVRTHWKHMRDHL